MCIIYFGTLDNPFSFYIGSSDWHHGVFLLPRERRASVPLDSLYPTDQTFLRDKYPDAGQGALCNLCVRSARPSAFFSCRSASTSPSAPQSVASGLQVPSAPRVVSGAATSLATESVESGVVEPSASVAKPSTAATGSDRGMIADQCCTPTQNTVRCKWEACVHFSSSSRALFVHGKPIFSARQMKKKCKNFRSVNRGH